MSIINLIQISHDYGNKLLFDNLNLSFDNQTKAGFVGRNGTGKTTLFKIMTGDIVPYKGNVHKARNYQIGYFAQDHAFSCKERLWEWLYQSNTKIINKKNELNTLEHDLSINHTEKNLNRLHDLQTEFDLLGGYNYENEIKSMLITFGFTEKDYNKQIDDFSGGEKTRIRLINILLQKADFILFDEPTNHLDLLTVDWFISYLKSLNCGYLIVSHDRYLLDQAVNRIYELKNKKIEVYNGNFTAYQQQVIERELVLQRQYAQQQKFIEKTEDFIRRNMAGQKTNQAKSRLKLLNRMEKIELNPQDKNIKLNFQTSQRSGNDIYRLKDLKIGYGNNVLVNNINLSLHYRDKICLVGANGTGKTTLLKILNGELTPLNGELWTGYNLSVGYYDQHHIDLDNSLTVLETIWNLCAGESFGFVMTYLARFGFFEEMIEQRVSNLSGGEKSRLFLAQLIFEKPNLLILDEPTNHLDLSMIQSLETALKNYDGTLILVSHDRYFISSITNQYWVIKDKTIKAIETNSLNLQELIEKTMGSKDGDTNKSMVTEKTQSTKKTNPIVLNKYLTEIKNCENLIINAEEEMHNIQNKFSDADFYTDKSNITEANQQIENLKNEIASLSSKKDLLETEYLHLLE